MLTRTNRGDTIIEVMFSFAVFSLIAVSSIIIMNLGVAMAQRSLEITLARQQIDNQIAIISHIKQVNEAEWETIKGYAQDSIASFGSMNTCPSASDLESNNAFFVTRSLDERSVVSTKISSTITNYKPAVAFAMTDVMRSITPDEGSSYGLWANLVKAEGFNANRAYDLHVRACWPSVGLSQPITIGTVTRIYD